MNKDHIKNTSEFVKKMIKEQDIEIRLRNKEIIQLRGFNVKWEECVK